MDIIKVKNYDEMSLKLNELFVEQVKKKPDSVLSFTTGKTPAGMAAYFVEAVNGGLDISNTIMMNLDEYVGKQDGTYSVHTWMYRHIYDKISTMPREIHMFDAEAEDQAGEIKRYKEIMRKYPRDIQMLGLGTNGHIGANEPGTPFDAEAFVADSEESTIEATMNLFHLSYEETPRQMFTMGFKEIMESKTVVLAVSGAAKANAVKQLVKGDITTDLPASYLKNHDHFILIVDEDAYALI